MFYRHPVIFYRLPVIGLCMVIFWQSCFSSPISAPLFPQDDKVMHFLVYALLAFLTVRDLNREKPSWPLRKIIWAAILFSAVYGLSDELHQALVPARCASFADLLADSAGSCFGALSAGKYSRHSLT